MIKIKLEDVTETLSIKLEGSEGGMLPMYQGTYRVTPKVDEQVLETKNKSMADDVTVESIPYSEVENASGGLTVNIAF